jgi:hypothetical protein
MALPVGEGLPQPVLLRNLFFYLLVCADVG